MLDSIAKKKLAILLLLIPLALTVSVCIGAEGEMMCGDRDAFLGFERLSTIEFVEEFNRRLALQGYSITIDGIAWKRVSLDTCTLTTCIKNPLDIDASCTITVYTPREPSEYSIVRSIRLTEVVVMEADSTGSALILPAETIFALFTPNYPANPDVKYGGYSFNELWQRFLAALQEQTYSDSFAYLADKPRKRSDVISYHVYKVEVAPAEGGITRTLDWYWH